MLTGQILEETATLHPFYRWLVRLLPGSQRPSERGSQYLPNQQVGTNFSIDAASGVPLRSRVLSRGGPKASRGCFSLGIVDPYQAAQPDPSRRSFFTFLSLFVSGLRAGLRIMARELAAFRALSPV